MNRVLNSGGKSGPSVGASSLVTDANSALSGGAHLQRSASINADPYTRLPASPLSFSSGNLSISGSSVVDGSSIMQQSASSVNRLESNQEQGSQHMPQRKQQGSSSTTSQATTNQTPQHQAVSPMIQIPTVGSPLGSQQSSYINQNALQQLIGSAMPGTFSQDPRSILMQHNQVPKCRLDARQDGLLQQHLIQQLIQRQDSGLSVQLPRQDSLQLQGINPQLQAAIHHQRLLQRQQQLQQQQQHLLQSLTPMHRTHMQQQQQLRHHTLQPSVQTTCGIKRPYESGGCALRIMEYILHQRQRPADNNILYWRKFVAEYFAPRAKKRWCLASYDNAGRNTIEVFPQSAMEVWQCEICGSKSGKGFETTVEVLPRLQKVKFDSGVIDELLFLDMPLEHRLPSGIMLLECAKAVQETVYEKLRVVHECQLRIVFSPDLKILAWESCTLRHEELLPRRLVAPQVHQLVQAAQKYQKSLSESGSSGLSTEDLQSNCGMFVTAGQQLGRVLELQALNEFGYSKRYIRCLQISEVVNRMKDLIDFSREQNISPSESLKTYPRLTDCSKLRAPKQQKMDPMSQGIMDQTSLSRVMAVQCGPSNPTSSFNGGSGALSFSSHPRGSTGFQNLLRHNSIGSNRNAVSQETNSFATSNQVSPQLSSFQGPISSVPVSLHNMAMNNMAMNNVVGLSTSQHMSMNPSMIQTAQPQPSPQNQQSQQHALQHLMQDVLNNGGSGAPSLCSQNANVNSAEHVFQGASGSMVLASGFPIGNNETDYGNGISNNVPATVPSRNSSFKSTASNQVTFDNNNFNLGLDSLQNLALPDLVQDISDDFADGIFGGEPGDLGYGW